MNIKHTLFSWLPLAVAVTCMSALVYGTVQHNYRSSFNDPQIQIAEDIAAGLSEGKTLNQFQPIDIGKSLATFIIVYNDKSEVLGGSGLLDGKSPKPPQGVFDYTREKSQDRITWEPKDDVRIAMVMNSFSSQAGSGFVLVGKNMRELEKREKDLAKKVAFAWVFTLLATAFVSSWPMLLPMMMAKMAKMKMRDEDKGKVNETIPKEVESIHSEHHSEHHSESL